MNHSYVIAVAALVCCAASPAASASDARCAGALDAALKTDLALSYEDFDQTPGQGFRRLARMGCSKEAADLIEASMEKAISQKRVTYDFERLMEGATKLKTSEFASAMIENM